MKRIAAIAAVLVIAVACAPKAEEMPAAAVTDSVASVMDSAHTMVDSAAPQVDSAAAAAKSKM